MVRCPCQLLLAKERVSCVDSRVELAQPVLANDVLADQVVSNVLNVGSSAITPSLLVSSARRKESSVQVQGGFGSPMESREEES